MPMSAGGKLGGAHPILVVPDVDLPIVEIGKDPAPSIRCEDMRVLHAQQMQCICTQCAWHNLGLAQVARHSDWQRTTFQLRISDLTRVC